MNADTSLVRTLASIRKNAEAFSTFARQYPFLLRFAVSPASRPKGEENHGMPA